MKTVPDQEKRSWSKMKGWCIDLLIDRLLTLQGNYDHEKHRRLGPRIFASERSLTCDKISTQGAHGSTPPGESRSM